MARSEIARTVNQLFIREMSRQGMSRADIARRLKVAPETVSIALNNTQRDWKIQTLQEWAKALDCDLVITLERKDENQTS